MTPDVDLAPAAFEDLAVGDEPPGLTVGPVSREDFVRYAGASGDFNPIHFDEDAAAAAGNDSYIGQGMFTAGVLSAMVVDWLGLEPIRSFSTRFARPVEPGERLRASGEVVERDPTERSIEADLSVRTLDGATVVTGRTTAVLPRRS